MSRLQAMRRAVKIGVRSGRQLSAWRRACVFVDGVAVAEPGDGDELSASVVHGGRASACSYRSYLSYDELTPDSLTDERLSLVSGRTSTTPGPNVALVTPNGTLYRLSDRSFHPINVVPEDAGPTLDDGGAVEVGSAELDDVFIDDDASTAADDDDEARCSSVFEFAMSCLRRQPPNRTAVVSRRAYDVYSPPLFPHFCSYS